MSSDKEIIEKEKVLNGDQQQETSEQDEPQEHHEDHGHPDLTNYSKEDLLKELQAFKSDNNQSRSWAYLKDIRGHFDEIVESEKSEALQKFTTEGGEETDFQFLKNPVDKKFDELYSKIRSELSDKQAKLEEEKEKNLRLKRSILDKLRELTSAEESSTSLTAFKDLQNEWKNSGPVPAAYTRDLWANYNALVEMFYNNRSIYFELKELDRKKNLESKVELVEKAEQLVVEPQIVESIKELRKLHEEYKAIGPVPKEEQEVLWTRMKAASDKIYERRNAELGNQKKVQEQNLSQKQDMVEQVKSYASFDTEEINAWKDKTKEILEVQNKWKAIGAVPKDNAKEISKEFWQNYKQFFKNKDLFFRKLEDQKKENLRKKLELVEKAEQLKDAEDLSSTADQLKSLQLEWQKIGPVPGKEKDEVFARFKAACDQFFNRKREAFAESEKEYVGNLEKKLEIIDKINVFAKQKENDPSEIESLQQEFESIGFVPKSEVKNIREKYKAAVENYLQNLDGVEGKDKARMKLSLEVSAIKNTPNSRQKLGKKEGEIIKKIHKLKADVQTFKTNVEFLANSPRAEALKKQVEKNIEESERELKLLNEQLGIVREGKY